MEWVMSMNRVEKGFSQVCVLLPPPFTQPRKILFEGLCTLYWYFRCLDYHGDIASETLMSAAAAFEAFLQDESALEERCPVGGFDSAPRRLVDMAHDEVDKCRQALTVQGGPTEFYSGN